MINSVTSKIKRKEENDKALSAKEDVWVSLLEELKRELGDRGSEYLRTLLRSGHLHLPDYTSSYADVLLPKECQLANARRAADHCG